MQSQKFESAFHPAMKARSPQSSVLRRLLAASLVTMGAIAADTILLSVQAASLTKWHFDPAANQLEITVKDGTTPRYFLMAQPARIVVDLPDTAVGDVSAQKTYSGAVRQIRVSQFEPGLTRIVMEISPGVSLAPGQVKLQKVGNEAARSGNAQWILRPLITKSLSASTVAVEPSTAVQPSPRAIDPVGSATKPPVARATTIAPNATTSDRTKRPIAKPQALATSDRPSASVAPRPLAPRPLASRPVAPKPVASTPVDSSKPPASATPTTAVRNTVSDDQPSVVVPDVTAVPPPPVALAPVLPSPTPDTKTATPLPPTVAPPVDSNVAVDTRSGVAIAVPAPAAPPTTTLSLNGMPLQSSVAASTQPVALASPTKPVVPVSRSTVEPTRRAIAQPPTRSSSSPSSAPAIVKPTPAAIASRSMSPTTIGQPSTTAQPSTTTILSASDIPTSDIPTTVAAAPSVPTPSVSVPPLNTSSTFNPSGTSPDTAPAQPTQPNAAFEAPLGAVPNSASTQPSVSVPPLIQVGTPSLSLSNGLSPAAEAAPSTSVFSPNARLTPPVEVPPLQPTPAQMTAPSIVQPGTAQRSYDANTVRQPASSANLAPPLSSMPLAAPSQPRVVTIPTTPGYDATTIRQPPTSVASSSIVEFGQPLPATSRIPSVGQPLSSLPNASTGVRQAFKPAAPNVVLPAGTTLNLRYPGNATLTLRAENPQQEILVLLTELRDVSGNLLAPAGSTVTGRFETTTAGSQFVTQAIVVAGRTVPLAAQSDSLDGARKVEGNNLARNSGIGGLAGGVLGALSGSVGLGALGGAAAGAATTLLTAPKPAIIQPGQIVQVRLTQDLRSAE